MHTTTTYKIIKIFILLINPCATMIRQKWQVRNYNDDVPKMAVIVANAHKKHRQYLIYFGISNRGYKKRKGKISH